jgi:hypothetical protein
MSHPLQTLSLLEYSSRVNARKNWVLSEDTTKNCRKFTPQPFGKSPGPRNVNRTTLEDMLDSLAETFADTFANLPGPLRRTHANVLACQSATLSNSSRCLTRVQPNQVRGALSRAGGQVACALGRALPYISAPASDVATGAAALLFGVNCPLSRRTLIRARLALGLATGRHNSREPEQQQRNESEFDFHGRSPHIY